MPSLGILIGGGPAPGINSAISAAVIEAINRRVLVAGIYDGFEHLMKGRTDMVRPLAISDVSRIHFQGGSILRTSRANPTESPGNLRRTVETLRDLGLSYVVTIGGDDTAFAASEVAKASDGSVRIAHIPKTIDNDLPLPGGMPTFGYESARHVGAEMVRNLMEDSRTTTRWFFVVAMGRKAGHLALGIGKAAGASLTIIPEEFPEENVTLTQVGDVLEGAMLKRLATGRRDGVAIVAEGIAEKLEPAELAQLPGVEDSHDQYGHIRLGEIPLAMALKREVKPRFDRRGDEISITDMTLGYELRSAPPIPFDIDYTRTLGHGAVQFLLSPPTEDRFAAGGVVAQENGHLQVLSFDELRDPITERTRIRVVDIHSEHYTVARDYMLRIERRDLEDLGLLGKLAQVAKTTPEEFRARFSRVVRFD
jgi:6-phosphofructokinase